MHNLNYCEFIHLPFYYSFLPHGWRMSAGFIGNYSGPIFGVASISGPSNWNTDISGFGKGRCRFKPDLFVTRRRTRPITFAVMRPEDFLCWVWER
ncbi:hypothetical protein CEXT_761301 [Caerostris extrusa]|uniref:Uncharacterized protein n=1 Tax=Caerostris extrusa TaxID=172846 RepID=A0AAV4SGS8_CAEEX|nr:hypothetical protein CEXT_761301 [Caerostris extrusa]